MAGRSCFIGLNLFWCFCWLSYQVSKGSLVGRREAINLFAKWQKKIRAAHSLRLMNRNTTTKILLSASKHINQNSFIFNHFSNLRWVPWLDTPVGLRSTHLFSVGSSFFAHGVPRASLLPWLFVSTRTAFCCCCIDSYIHCFISNTLLAAYVAPLLYCKSQNLSTIPTH